MTVKTENSELIFEDDIFYTNAKVAEILRLDGQTIARRMDRAGMPFIGDKNSSKTYRSYKGLHLNQVFGLHKNE